MEHNKDRTQQHQFNGELPLQEHMVQREYYHMNTTHVILNNWCTLQCSITQQSQFWTNSLPNKVFLFLSVLVKLHYRESLDVHLRLSVSTAFQSKR